MNNETNLTAYLLQECHVPGSNQLTNVGVFILGPPAHAKFPTATVTYIIHIVS